MLYIYIRADACLMDAVVRTFGVYTVNLPSSFLLKSKSRVVVSSIDGRSRKQNSVFSTRLLRCLPPRAKRHCSSLGHLCYIQRKRGWFQVAKPSLSPSSPHPHPKKVMMICGAHSEALKIRYTRKCLKKAGQLTSTSRKASCIGSLRLFIRKDDNRQGSVVLLYTTQGCTSQESIIAFWRSSLIEGSSVTPFILWVLRKRIAIASIPCPAI